MADSYQLSINLRSVVSLLHKALRKEITQASSYSMTELDTIIHVYQNERILPTDLAEMAHITTPSMSQILKKLKKDGIIERIPSRSDKRKVYVSMTLSGKSMIEKVRYSKDGYLKNLIDERLSVKEQELLEQAVAILNKLISI